MCVCACLIAKRKSANGYCNDKETGTSLFRFLFENMAWKHQRRKCESNKNGASSQKTKIAKTAKTAKHENYENREKHKNHENCENSENCENAKTAKMRKPREQENAEETSTTVGRISRFSCFLGFLGFLVFSFPCISSFWPRRVDFLLSCVVGLWIRQTCDHQLLEWLIRTCIYCRPCILGMS